MCRHGSQRIQRYLPRIMSHVVCLTMTLLFYLQRYDEAGRRQWPQAPKRVRPHAPTRE